MKNLDVVSKRILAVGLSAAAIILSLTLFMATTSTASAGNGSIDSFDPNTNLSMPAAGNGKIMMDYTSVHVPSQDKTYYEVMVWNTETGESKLYFYSYDSKRFKAYEENVQLPANPL